MKTLLVKQKTTTKFTSLNKHISTPAEQHFRQRQRISFRSHTHIHSYTHIAKVKEVHKQKILLDIVAVELVDSAG